MFRHLFHQVLRVPRRHSSTTPTFDPKHLEVLVCPLSKKPLILDNARQLLINEELGIAYRIIDGIPNLIPEEALTDF
ncbi:protein preY mitochondrial [Echinococcus multilocularis]|uniref:Protein preY, mitochondrial n=1 Tax=Echinococcus multilocularis TaxID=6211 RepID=A0A068Y800_ECHMU|nr:protein preY mitochondrial [Echinococcus multilocularis]